MSRVRRERAAALATSLALALCAVPTAAGQAARTALRVETAVEPQQVTVGDPFHSMLRVSTPPGYRVEYGEVASGDSLQALAPVDLSEMESGAPAGVYRLVAWVAGVPLRAEVEVRVIGPDGATQPQRLSLELPEVLSVLPASGESIEPRPPKGVIPPPAGEGGLPWWWWLALLLGALLAALLAYWLLRRYRRAELEPPMEPREWALAQLRDERLAQLVRAGDLVEFFRRVSWIVRTYAFRVDPRLSPDLTTTELVDRIAGDPVSPDLVGSLAGILRSADRVKFARYWPAGAEAEQLLESAREWVSGYPEPLEDDAEEPRRAA